jgi:hypothetical protein
MRLLRLPGYAQTRIPPSRVCRQLPRNALERFVLNDEVRRGHVDYDPATDTYRLNGGLDAEVKQAIRDLRV